MAVYTLEFFDLIQHKSYTILNHLFVTGVTVDLCMFPVQRESRSAMVEVVRRPPFKTVTTRTICNAIFFKLTVMNILMTGAASSSQIYKFPIRIARFRDMAGPAFLLNMDSKQLKRRLIMIKLTVPPSGSEMAAVTSVIRIIFLRDLPLVNIIVTIHTCRTHIPELPSVSLEVTSETGCSQMSAIQRETSVRMILKRKRTALKTIFGMTLRTVGCDILSGELTLMVVRMTRCTGIVW